MSKIYFFSYGDDKYKNSKIRIEQEAKNFGLFNYIGIYGPENIDTEFLEKTKPWIDMPRGRGYWLWKSCFLKKTFELMNDGDYCVYCDAGCTINPYGQNRFKEYLELIDNKGILSFRMDGLDEEQYTSEAIFKHFEVENDEILRKSGQIMATILIMKKCEESIKLINEYYELAINHTHLFSDINIEGNCNRFVDFRHDQSVLSVMRKKYGSIEIVDETWAPDMNGWNNLIYNKKIPFLATRIRN